MAKTYSYMDHKRLTVYHYSQSDATTLVRSPVYGAIPANSDLGLIKRYARMATEGPACSPTDGVHQPAAFRATVKAPDGFYSFGKN
jgi:hypothetical protein